MVEINHFRQLWSPRKKIRWSIQTLRHSWFASFAPSYEISFSCQVSKILWNACSRNTNIAYPLFSQYKSPCGHVPCLQQTAGRPPAGFAIRSVLPHQALRPVHAINRSLILNFTGKYPIRKYNAQFYTRLYWQFDFHYDLQINHWITGRILIVSKTDHTRLSTTIQIK